MRLGYDTFNFQVNIISSSLQKQDIHMQDCILVEKHVALSLACLDIGNSLMSCWEPFGILDSTTSIIFRKFCHIVKAYLKPLLTPKLTSLRIAKISANFESLYGILLILGVIDGSHISIIAPKVDMTFYYCRKGFYSSLIQEVVDANVCYGILIINGQKHLWLDIVSIYGSREENGEREVFAIQAHR